MSNSEASKIPTKENKQSRCLQSSEDRNSVKPNVSLTVTVSGISSTIFQIVRIALYLLVIYDLLHPKPPTKT